MASSSEPRALAAFRDGIGRVNRAPLMLLGVSAVTLLVALPFSLVLRAQLEAHLGGSLAADAAAEGVNYDWWQEFSAQATGLASTFVPSIIGFGAVLDNFAARADNLPTTASIPAAIAGWLAIWSFLSGGILDRYARNRPTRAHGFFAAAGTHFWRFLRLGIVALAVYSVLFGWVHGWLFENLYDWLTRSVTVERTAFLIRGALYLFFGLALVAVNLVFDYARVRMVVEDRRSALGALLAGLRFVRRHRRVAYLYALNTGVFLVLVGLYALAAPGAPGSGVWMWITLGVGQLYILGRHYVKLLFYASEVAFFQRAAAHAGYTAAPPLVWPDSPAVEAVLNADVTAR